MFKKLMCSMLSLCVFAVTMPMPVYASSWGGDVIEIDSEVSDIHPIMDVIAYKPPAPKADEKAYFAFTDEKGQLWDFDVNISRKTATVISNSNTYGTAPLSADQTTTMAAIARMAASSPDNRLPVDAETMGSLFMGVIAVITVGLTMLGLYLDQQDRDLYCESQYHRDLAQFSVMSSSCAAAAATHTCTNRFGTYPARPVINQDAGDPSMCRGPTGQCSGWSC